MVADRCIHAVYHNKHALATNVLEMSTSMTLNPKNIGFSDFLAIFGCKRVNSLPMKWMEIDQDYLRTGTDRLSRVS